MQITNIYTHELKVVHEKYQQSHVCYFSSLQILELNLDSCRAPSIDGLTEEFSELESLSLINVGLTSLKAFPNLPKLQKV
jgi:Leucine-rich repeat (LRR) protein